MQRVLETVLSWNERWFPPTKNLSPSLTRRPYTILLLAMTSLALALFSLLHDLNVVTILNGVVQIIFSISLFRGWWIIVKS